MLLFEYNIFAVVEDNKIVASNSNGRALCPSLDYETACVLEAEIYLIEYNYIDELKSLSDGAYEAWGIVEVTYNSDYYGEVDSVYNVIHSQTIRVSLDAKTEFESMAGCIELPENLFDGGLAND